ncbi:MAG: hypothetical protein JWO22_2994 [Frankiales bacterium]|nr:hypothetical protein [Frankiales bacterium]
MSRPAWTRDPATPSLALFAGVVLTGFVAIGLGWRVAARTLLVAAQVPALVSGALGGLVLVTLGAGLASVQSSRRLAATERAETELLLDEAHALVQAFKARQS